MSSQKMQHWQILPTWAASGDNGSHGTFFMLICCIKPVHFLIKNHVYGCVPARRQNPLNCWQIGTRPSIIEKRGSTDRILHLVTVILAVGFLLFVVDCLSILVIVGYWIPCHYTRESFPQFLHNKPAFHNCHIIFRWCWWEHCEIV